MHLKPDVCKGPTVAMISYRRHVAEEFQFLPSAFSLEKKYALKYSSCFASNYSFEESTCALHSIPSVEEEEKEHMHAQFGDLARFYHSYLVFIIFAQSGRCPRVFLSFQKRGTES